MGGNDSGAGHDRHEPIVRDAGREEQQRSFRGVRHIGVVLRSIEPAGKDRREREVPEFGGRERRLSAERGARIVARLHDAGPSARADRVRCLTDLAGKDRPPAENGSQSIIRQLLGPLDRATR